MDGLGDAALGIAESACVDFSFAERTVMTAAKHLLKRYGALIAREHCKRPDDGCMLYKCERGHADCAHSKHGACLRELARLVVSHL